MRVFLSSLGFLAVVLGLLYHFAALRVFSLLVPKDAGVANVQSAVAYGPDPRHRLDLYTPEGQGPFPVLLFVYGGSWDSGHRQDYGFVGHAFAARGFLTAIADYRLVPDAHYPDFVDDAALAVAWLAAESSRFGGDSSRLCVAGHSAGAYTGVQAVLRNGLRHKVKALVSLAGPFDFLPLDSPKTIAAFGAVSNLEETQPVSADLADAPPLLLLHGRDDTTVGLHNSWNMKAAYDRAGRTSGLKIYDGIGHVGILLALAKPLRGRAPVLDDAAAFLHKYC